MFNRKVLNSPLALPELSNAFHVSDFVTVVPCLDFSLLEIISSAVLKNTCCCTIQRSAHARIVLAEKRFLESRHDRAPLLNSTASICCCTIQRSAHVGIVVAGKRLWSLAAVGSSSALQQHRKGSAVARFNDQHRWNRAG